MLQKPAEKLDKLLKESQKPFRKKFFQEIANIFNSSVLAGNSDISWSEIGRWLQHLEEECMSPDDASRNDTAIVELNPNNPKELSQLQKGEKLSITDLSELEFEARSSKDGAWYDVDMFIAHRFVESGEIEVRARFVGFGAEEDEWVNIRQSVRERSIPFEQSECHKVKAGDQVCCLQERKDQALYYDAHVIGIQRRTHDIRGCRCLFLVRYDHDGSEERVHLRRLCGRPTY